MAAQTYVVDCTEILRMLAELTSEAKRLDCTTTEVDYDRGRGRHNDPEQAAMSRDLLRLTELSRLVAQEFSQIYWSFKGYEDPRFVA